MSSLRPTPLTIWLPMMGSVSGLATIATVYWLTFRHGHLPHGVYTPPISLLGCQAPEHAAYQVGFSVTAVLLGVVIYHWTRWFVPRIATQFGPWSAWTMRLSAVAALLGLVGQGVVTLQQDLLVILLQQPQPSTAASETITLSAQSIWHQQLAALFFVGAALHCYTTVYYIWASSSSTTTTNMPNSPLQQLSPSTCCCYGVTSRRIKFKTACLSLVSWPLAEALHPARSSTISSGTTVNWNVAGLAQYISVASYILFFGSYSVDFAGLVATNDERKHNKES